MNPLSIVSDPKSNPLSKVSGGKAAANPSPRPKLPAKVVRDLQSEHERELKRLSDIAFAFLLASGGNVGEAEKLLEWS